jgi:hypothetical protein
MANPYRATRYSVLSLRPAAWAGDGVPNWEHWDKWAIRMGILDKHGQPSLKKVKFLIRHHCIAAKLTKNCIPRTLQGYHPVTGKAIYRRMKRIVVHPRFPDQMEWGPEEWQDCYQGLFSRSQSWRGKGKSKKRKK